MSISFQTVVGGQGKGTGTLTGTVVKSVTSRSTAPECPGSYDGSLKFVGDDEKNSVCSSSSVHGGGKRRAV